MKNTQKQPELYWLDKPYTPGCIFSHMLAMDYETVVSLDIGHGECVAFQYLMNHAGDWVAEKLQLTEKGESSIPSYVTYIPNGNGQAREGKERVLIGYNATGRPSKLIAYFKKDPSQWDNFHDNDDHKTRQIMGDFIKTLWTDILAKNETLRNTPKDKVLITIGCPASPDWTSMENMEAYRELAREATTYDNVIIIPESTAAIMSVIYSRLGTQIRLDRGVAVYDLGSSTIDFTFICMGKVIVTRSLALGGSNIDRALLEIIARENLEDPDDPEENGKVSGYEKKHTLYRTENLLPQEREKACTQVRRVKEKFFDGGESELERDTVCLHIPIRVPITPGWICSMGMTDPKHLAKALWGILLETNELENIEISMAEEIKYRKKIEAGIQQVLESGEPLELTIDYTSVLSYEMNRNLMDSALRLIRWDQLEAPYTDVNWYDAVKSFFENTHALIENYGCDAVILTGGTSKVTCVRQFAEACYETAHVYNEPDTSVSVARGMCHATGQEVAAAKKIPALKETLQKDQKPYFKSICKGFAQTELYAPLWTAWKQAAQQLAADGCTHTEADWENAVGQWTFENEAFVEKIRQKLQQYLDSNLSRCVKDPKTCPCKEEPEFTGCDNCKKSDNCVSLIRDRVNQLSSEVYKVDITRLPAVSQDMILKATQMIEQESVKDIISSMKPAKLAKEVGTDYAFTPAKGKRVGMWRTLQYVGKMFEDSFFRKNMDPERCNLIAEAFADPQMYLRERTLFSDRLGRKLETEVPRFAEIFGSLMEKQVEIALGIVLFQIFEESNMQ